MRGTWSMICPIFIRGVAQLGARVLWEHEVAGSIPVTPTICGYRISVILQPSKLVRWVRFPLPAPLILVNVVQLVERQIVVLVVVGSSPIIHPM